MADGRSFLSAAPEKPAPRCRLLRRLWFVTLKTRNRYFARYLTCIVIWRIDATRRTK